MPENLNVDVYSNDTKADTLQYNGRLTTKISVITDPKKIKDYYKEASFRNVTNSPEKINSVNSSFNTTLTQSPETSPKKYIPTKRIKGNPYKISINDPSNVIAQKFIQLLALGPIAESLIVEKLDITSNKLRPLMTDFAQVYNPRDSFTQDDKFPNLERIRRKIMKQRLSTDAIESEEFSSLDSDSVPITEPVEDTTTKFILKDKSYKEFQPWNWSFYSPFERKLIIQNVHRALTRLGYSESHPLRKKICEVSTPSSEDDKKATSLGGGFLISKSKKQPILRAPAKAERKSTPNTPGTTSPSRSQPSTNTKSSTSISSISSSSTNGKRKFSISSNSSSSDDEKHLKKMKINDSDTSPSSEEDNVPLSRRVEVKSESDNPPPEIKSASKRLEYYNNLAVKFKLKYNEYEILYNQLKNPKANQNKSDNKKQLLKLFELHNSLSQWKKTLWDFDNETKSKSKIMNLSKHKKNGSSNATTSPFIAKLQNDDILRAQSASPAPQSKPQSPSIASRFTSRPSSSASRLVSTAATEPLKSRSKLPLNY